jgi:hypothetical protein
VWCSGFLSRLARSGSGLFSGPCACSCKVVGNRILFCPLHESAESLLAACEHLRTFLRGVTLAEPKEQNILREVILPYLDGQIAAAEKKC